jgi:hypothetical protein
MFKLVYVVARLESGSCMDTDEARITKSIKDYDGNCPHVLEEEDILFVVFGSLRYNVFLLKAMSCVEGLVSALHT